MGVFASLADLLEYPDERLSERLDECVDVMQARAHGTTDDPAAALISRFRTETNALSIERLQELYASAFDMDPECALYAGHHLFGADVRRGIFMASLAAEYRQAGLDAARELPDYLPAVLRYIERTPSGTAGARDELIEAVLLPATRKLSDALDRRRHPYALVMRALLAVLEVAQVHQPLST